MTTLSRSFRLDRAKSIVGWMTDSELLFLAEVANRSNIIFEAGSFQGKSTRAMADNSDAIIYAIDPWKPMHLTQSGLVQAGVDEMTYTRFCMNLHPYIESGRVIPIGKKFVDFDPVVVPDFIFIDALHDYDNCKADILHALNLMKHGLLAGHDYQPGWPGVIKAVDEIFGKGKVLVTDTIWSIKL